MLAQKHEQAAASGGSLGKRIASSVILAPAALATMYVGGPVFAAVVAFAAVVMTFEWTRMIEGRDFSIVFYVLALSGAAAFALASAGQYALAYGLCLAGGIGAGLASLRTSRRALWAAFGAVYILAPSVALIWLRSDIENGRALTLMLFLIVWSADTGGYFGGRLVGGPKMSPVVSPAKTWAGAVGGVTMGSVAGFAIAAWVFGGGGFVFYILVGASLGLASILGDMAESAFKRTFGVKDVSGFIPGHGGALDRLDGMIFATTAMTLVLYLHILLGRFQG
jgi:phosphatidate cytidylyltransferase